MKFLSFAVILILLLGACTSENEPAGVESPFPVVESIIDFSNMENWTFHPNKVSGGLEDYNLNIAVIDKDLSISETIDIADNSRINTGVDVFFVHPTILISNPVEAVNVPILEQPESLINGTTFFQAGLLSKYGRIFAPRYRQSSGVTYFEGTAKAIQAEVIATSYSDIKAAFLDYMENYNQGNKIILAGHSQGSQLLGMLLYDLFDDDPGLRSQLVTAALGGTRNVFAANGFYVGGWWQNIPLCTTEEECGCIHNWASYKEGQEILELNSGLPIFNADLINYGLIGRTADLDTDWFVQDAVYYTETSQPLRYYIAPDAFYNLADGYDFIAFDNMYTARYVRDSQTQATLRIDYVPDPEDERPDDLPSEILNPDFDLWGYHVKDYHIYLWALMEQIDQKLINCP